MRSLALALCAAFLAMASAGAEEGAGLDPAACRWLEAYRPAPDVAYQPGVDVNGNPVAPADLPGSPALGVPDTMTIPLTTNLAKRLHLGGDRPLRADAVLGTIELRDGRAFFNGQPLDAGADDGHVEICRQQRQP